MNYFLVGLFILQNIWNTKQNNVVSLDLKKNRKTRIVYYDHQHPKPRIFCFLASSRKRLSGLMLGPLGEVFHYKTIALTSVQLAVTTHIRQKSVLAWRQSQLPPPEWLILPSHNRYYQKNNMRYSQRLAAPNLYSVIV